MKFVVVMDVPEDRIGTDSSIEHACYLANDDFNVAMGGVWGAITVRPLSEEMAC